MRLCLSTTKFSKSAASYFVPTVRKSASMMSLYWAYAQDEGKRKQTMRMIEEKRRSRFIKKEEKIRISIMLLLSYNG